MQILIDISEDAYNYIKANGARIPYYRLTDAIKNGTPLSKGHGRLIDADKLISSFPNYDGMSDIAKTIDYAPTVVEADKE